MFCKNCGVELEPDMEVCPLCGEPLQGAPRHTPASALQTDYLTTPPGKTQRKFTWEIISIILGSGILAACIVDVITSGRITWSEYMMSAGLVIFCYTSVLSLWNKNILIELAGGFLLSAVCLLVLDWVTGGINWALRLAVPLLLSITVIGIAFIHIIRIAGYKGINLIAYAFLGAALICFCTEGVLSCYRNGVWHFSWSAIVAACVVPVVVILLFVHFRLRKGRNLRRTFHL